MKRFSDVTIDEWKVFFDAAEHFLGMTRMLIWETEKDHPDEDQSYMEAERRMASAFELIGMPQGSYEEAKFNLEGLLKSGKIPSAAIGPEHCA